MRLFAYGLVVLTMVQMVLVPPTMTLIVGAVESGVDLDIGRAMTWLRNGVSGRAAPPPS